MGKLLGQGLAEIASLKAEKIIVSPTDYNGIGVFDRHSQVYREILELLRGCASEVIARSNPDGTDPTGSNARKYTFRAGNGASTESNADSAHNPIPTPSGSGLSSSSFEIIIAESKAPEMPCYVRTAINKNPTFGGRSDIIS